MTARLIAWLTLQLLAIGVVVLRIPLSAQYPRPAESLALHLLLSAQVVGTALLFPFLLRDLRAAILVMFTGLPFQFAATFLAGREIHDVVPAVALANAWIAVLAIWSLALRSDIARSIGVAMGSCLTLGAGVIAYFRLEFAPQANEYPFENASPLLATLQVLNHSPPLSGWIPLIVLASAGLLTRLAQSHRAKRLADATSYPQPSPQSARDLS